MRPGIVEGVSSAASCQHSRTVTLLRPVRAVMLRGELALNCALTQVKNDSRLPRRMWNCMSGRRCIRDLWLFRGWDMCMAVSLFLFLPQRRMTVPAPRTEKNDEDRQTEVKSYVYYIHMTAFSTSWRCLSVVASMTSNVGSAVVSNVTTLPTGATSNLRKWIRAPSGSMSFGGHRMQVVTDQSRS